MCGLVTMACVCDSARLIMLLNGETGCVMREDICALREVENGGGIGAVARALVHQEGGCIM